MKVAAPVLLEACNYLKTKRTPSDLSDFNKATLLLLPKKETLLVEDTRPISANNLGNRLVARVLFLSVADAAQELVGDYQKMFLPGRQMSDHLRGLNEAYYRKVQEDKEFFVLFTDNSKAFDSIHHDFILAALSKQGFPPWFINAVNNLLTNVIVSPAIAPNSNTDNTMTFLNGILFWPLS